MPRKQSVTVKLQVGARWQHYSNVRKVKTSADSSLQCHSNQKQRADRQKIQMNTSFLPGLERSWWRGVLSRSCWLLATWDRSAVEGHRQNWTADSEFMEQPQMGFCHWTQLLFWIPSCVCSLHLNQQFRSHPIWYMTQINKGLARGAVPLNKISLSLLRSGWQWSREQAKDMSLKNRIHYRQATFRGHSFRAYWN